jgi:hypothetical protein
VRTKDPAERLAIIAVGQRVTELRQQRTEIERKNLAAEVGNNVGDIVSRAMSQLQNNLMAAMRRG